MEKLINQDVQDINDEPNIHTSYADEKAVLAYVRDGDVERLKLLYHSLPKIRYGRMSLDPMKELFYGSIANTTLITRYAIEGGLPEEEAFSLSDFYIRQMEQCLTESELALANERMAGDFTTRVAALKSQQQNYTRAVLICIDYIYAHRRERIRLSDLAALTNLSERYISHLFAKECGITISQYILNIKLEVATHLLKFSTYPCSEISEYLSFSSQSYFTSSFRKAYNMTPLAYREKFGSHKLT